MKQNKKYLLTIILKLIPIISTFISFILIFAKIDSSLLRHLTPITVLIAFFGFIFFFIGRKEKNKLIKILGLLDILSTISIILLYVLAIFSFGL